MVTVAKLKIVNSIMEFHANAGPDKERFTLIFVKTGPLFRLHLIVCCHCLF